MKLTILSLVLAPVLTAVPQAAPLRVVFSGQETGGSWDLWLADADGRRFHRGTNTPDIDERTPVLSPDRKLAAYSTSHGDIRLYNLYDDASTTLQLPTTGRCAWPAWSPDGNALYYVEILMGKGPDEGKVWRYDLKSARPEVVADEPEVEGWPSIDRTGVLLFTNWTQAMRSHLSMLDPSSKTPKPVWDSSLTLSGAAWLGGGQIALIAGDEISQKVVIVSAGRRVREYIVPGASGRATPLDGNLLLTRIVDGKASLYLLDLAKGTTRLWAQSPPLELAQLRDADYR